mmetsp:Transcript_17744/g.36845  ORF Transcript_17744/g.36845 Transcript_17744/m.36845 type:complete len:90 (+) Transcript_17744:661-930(+)
MVNKNSPTYMEIKSTRTWIGYVSQVDFQLISPVRGDSRVSTRTLLFKILKVSSQIVQSTLRRIHRFSVSLFMLTAYHAALAGVTKASTC